MIGKTLKAVSEFLVENKEALLENKEALQKWAEETKDVGNTEQTNSQMGLRD